MSLVVRPRGDLFLNVIIRVAILGSNQDYNQISDLSIVILVGLLAYTHPQNRFRTTVEITLYHLLLASLLFSHGTCNKIERINRYIGCIRGERCL